MSTKHQWELVIFCLWLQLMLMILNVEFFVDDQMKVKEHISTMYRHCASKCRTCPVSGFVPNWMWLSSVHKVSELLHFYQPKEKISLFSMFNTCSIFACLAYLIEGEQSLQVHLEHNMIETYFLLSWIFNVCQLIY